MEPSSIVDRDQCGYFRLHIAFMLDDSMQC